MSHKDRYCKYCKRVLGAGDMEMHTDLSVCVGSLRDLLAAVGDIISQNGCDCECGCSSYGESHAEDCDPCLPCRISDVLGTL